VSEQLALLPELLTSHLQLALAALLVGTVTSVPAGVLVSRVRWLEAPVLGVASVIQTVPSLALLAIMVPTLAALGLPSIGRLPAFLGLTLYSVLPILANTVSGLATVDPAVREAAAGVGMTGGQRLLRVELPLALPVVIAGVRTATVWTVGTATLSTPVGANSLGNYIFSGLQTRNSLAVLVGCVAAAALALLLDGLVRALAWGIERRRRPAVAAAIAAWTLLYGYAGASFVAAAAAVREGRVVVGAKTFTEQYILCEVLAGQVRRLTGLETEIVESLGSTVAFDALRSDQIDAYVDYTGTIWATIMHRSDVPEDPDEVLREVERYLASNHGVGIAAALGFENTYAFAMSRERAERLGIERISDLVPFAAGISIGGDYEFFARTEWRSVQECYGLHFGEQRSMDSALMYQAVAQGAVDLITAFSTDGRIAALDLVVLEDDRRAIPPYAAVVLVSPRLQRESPAAVAALRRLAGTVDAEEMRRMNMAVDRDGHSAASVAEGFLAELPVAAVSPIPAGGSGAEEP
jgi:osmoprotectant transport system permease protein